MEQFRVLQHLQELVAKHEQSQAPAGAEGVPGGSAELLEQLRGLMAPEQQKILEMAQQKLGDLSGLDESTRRKLEDALGSLPSDQGSARATAEEMLRRYHRTRQLPFSANSNNLEELLNAPERRASAPIDLGPPADSSRPNAANRTINTNPANLPPATARPAQPANDARTGQELRPIEPGRQAESGRQSQVGATGESTLEIASQEPSAQEPRAQELSAQASERRELQPSKAPSSGLPTSQNATLSARSQSARSLSPRSQSPRSSIEEPSVDKSVQQQPLNGPINKNIAPLDGTAIPTASELLKQAQANPTSLPPLRFPTNSLNLEEIKKFLAERFSSRNDNRDPWLDSLKRSLPTSLKAELNKTGLTQSLTKIMDEMKQGSGGKEEESPSDSRQIEFDAVKKSLDGATLGSIQQELEKISNLQSPTDKKNTSVPQETALSQTEKNNANKPPEDGFFKRASTIFNQWMPHATKDSPAATPAAGGATHPQTSLLILIAYVVIGLALLGFAVSFFLRRKKPSISYRVAELAQLKIATRADIVRAFHRMVGDLGMSTEDWWTHRRTTAEVARLKPSVERNLEILAGLYEIARYSPSEVQLTEDQIQQARRALEQIATC